MRFIWFAFVESIWFAFVESPLVTGLMFLVLSAVSFAWASSEGTGTVAVLLGAAGMILGLSAWTCLTIAWRCWRAR